MRSYFIIVIGIILFCILLWMPLVSMAEDVPEKKPGDWMSNIVIRASVFGGRVHDDNGRFWANNDDTPEVIHMIDRFWTEERSNWGSEFGIGYKLPYGVEIGISYMIQELNDVRIGNVLNDLSPPESRYNIVPWYERGSMDIDSRALMFNTRIYLDELTGWNMNRFSPYIFGSVGRATHKVSDFRVMDDAVLNGVDHNGDVWHEQYNFANNKNEIELACRVGLGTLLRLTDHISIDTSASFMDWGQASASRYYTNENDRSYQQDPIRPDIRTIQGSVGIQFNF